MNKTNLSVLFGLGLSAFAFGICESLAFSSDFCWTVAISLLCVCWWVLEPVPIPVTSLIPIAVFPAVGVLTPKQVGEAYGSPIILLLMGGAMLSTAMSHSGAHRRIALQMVRYFGESNQRQLICGFMLASASLSMWISNTATVLMLLPVATAIIERADNDGQAQTQNFAISLLLGIAFSASIGGLGTPIGTPPNLIFIQVYKEATGIDISFVSWMKIGMPVVALMLPITALWLLRKLPKAPSPTLPSLGPWCSHEKRVLIVFACTALLWITRKEPFGGWSQALNLETANDASVALIAVVAMFLIPRSDDSGEKLLTWRAASEIPWGVMLLFASGVCIAKAFTVSGLSTAIGHELSILTTTPIILMIFGIALVVSFLTETTSNTASAALLMPILAATAVAANYDPKLLMLPAAMSASCAFMLPIATGPNAIVFGSGKIRVENMVRAGLALNLAAALVITGACWLFV